MIPHHITDILAPLGHYAVCGGTIRDRLLGIDPRDLDIVSLADPYVLAHAFVNVPDVTFKCVASDWRECTFSEIPETETRILIKLPGVDIWSAREHGVTQIDPVFTGFDFTVNCFLAWETGEWSTHPDALTHLYQRKLVPTGREKREGSMRRRTAHMQTKGFDVASLPISPALTYHFGELAAMAGYPLDVAPGIEHADEWIEGFCDIADRRCA